MAVQAHYLSNPFMPDFRKRDALLEELQLQQHHEATGNVFLGAFNYAGPVFNGITVLSDPESELTCNVSASRKNRYDMQRMTPTHQQQQFRFVNQHKVQEKPGIISTGLHLSYEDNRINHSGATSTSGRPLPVSRDLLAYLCQLDDEVDALIHLQSERLRLSLEERRKRHCGSILSVLEQMISNKFWEKETELEDARAWNAELEKKVKQMSLENQIWQNVARNNEAIVANLKSSLEQVLLQSMGQTREGYDDSEAVPSTAAADDQQSCCFEGPDDLQATTAREDEELRHQLSCRACRGSESSVLLLPCRHLCLCKNCETRLDLCPVCNAKKDATIQVFKS